MEYKHEPLFCTGATWLLLHHRHRSKTAEVYNVYNSSVVDLLTSLLKYNRWFCEANMYNWTLVLDAPYKGIV